MVSNTNDATLKAILKYRNHPSIIVIRNKCQDKDRFSFPKVDQKQNEKEILKLDKNKSSQSFNIPIKFVKESISIFSNFFCNSFDNSIKVSTFREILKHADIIPLYKKGKKDIKKNHRLVCILPNFLKNI